MSNYSDIRKAAKKSHANAYANGGRVKGARTVININIPPSNAPGGMPAPMPAQAGPAVPPRPVPPAAAAAALGAMGSPPVGPGGAPGFANGGKVCGKMASGGAVKAGAASGVGRLAHNRKGK